MSAPPGGAHGVFQWRPHVFGGGGGEAPPTGDAPEGSSGFLKRSSVGEKELRLHSGVSQMSCIEIPVELQVRGPYERCIGNIGHDAKADSPFLEER